MNLVEILDYFELNKNFNNISGTDKNTGHSYIDKFYEKEFAKYKDKNISLLEIGIDCGASLKLWSEYFTNADKIVGIDIGNYIPQKYKDIKNVTYIFENAYTEQISKELGMFDIIIDDGPHTIESQVKTIEYYLPQLNKNGILIIEDIQDKSSIKKLEEQFTITSKIYNIDCVFEVIDLRYNKNRYDDLMFVIRL